MAETNINNEQWYIETRGVIKGPFPSKLIGSYLILGRITTDTRISLDKEDWKLISQVPSLIPEEVSNRNKQGGLERLERARMREDERRATGRRESSANNSPAMNTDEDEVDIDRRRKNDRRQDEAVTAKVYRKLREDLQHDQHQVRRYKVFGTVVLLVVVVILLASLFTLKPVKIEHPTDCNASPVAGVDWSNCNKTNSDLIDMDLRGVTFQATRLSNTLLTGSNLFLSNLAYADLSGANLSRVNLQRTKLVGASLKYANLTNADLRFADLSYADLTSATLQNTLLEGAKLDNAIWENGKVCKKGSIGQCN